MSNVVDLARYRRKRLGRRPTLGLIGLRSTCETVLRAALDAADPEDRATLFAAIVAGTYAEMLVNLTGYFEIGEAARATG